MRLALRHKRVLAATMALVVGTSLQLSVTAPSGASPSSICSKFSPTTVSKTLGVKATKSTKVVNGDVTVCWYQVGANAQAVFIRTQIGDNLAGYNADRKAAAAQSENPKVDATFKPLAAFSTSLGSPAYGVTFSVTVLKKGTEVQVGAANATLARVEALTKQVLSRV